MRPDGLSVLIRSPLPALSPRHQAAEHRIGLHFRGPERTSEGQTSQRPHAGEGHIALAGAKRPGAEIEAHIIEGQTLSLVDGDGPCGDERDLPVGSDRPVLDALALVVPLLPNLGPLRARDAVFVAGSVEADESPTLVDAHHGAEGAVVPAPLRVVLHGHDPRPNPQFEALGDRQPVSVDLQPPGDLAAEDNWNGRQSIQAALVVALCSSFGWREEELLSSASMWSHAPLV